MRVELGAATEQLLDQLLARTPPVWRSTTAAIDRRFSLAVAVRPDDRFALAQDDQTVLGDADLHSALVAFERRLKLFIAERARRRVFVHAGAVGWDGGAIVVPGRSTHGKTSLVAELVRRGATYYSDEYAVFDGCGRLHPYPVPLAIRLPGSQRQRRCPVESLGGRAGSRPLPVRLVLISRYRAGAPWEPRQLTPGQAVLELLEHAVAARHKPRIVVRTLEAATRDARILKGARGEAREVAPRLLALLGA